MTASSLRDFFRPAWQAFYLKAPYQRNDTKPGSAFLLLLAVCAILYIPGFIQLSLFMNEFKRSYIDPAIYQLPVMEVIQGEVSSPVNQPFRLYMEEDLLFLLDTSGEIESLDESGAWAYMGTDHFAMYESELRDQIRRFDFEGVDYLMFDPLSLKQWVDRFYPFLFPLIFIFSVAGLYIYRLIQILIFAAAATIVLNIMKRPVRFDLLLPLAVLALIPSLTLETLMNLGGVYFPGRGWLLFLMIAGYYTWGIRAFQSRFDKGRGEAG